MIDWYKSIILPHLLAFTATFFISAGWSWYHFARRPKLEFIGKAVVLWLVLTVAYFLAKKIYVFLVKKFRRHEFWSGIFLRYFDELFFLSSLFFLIFFMEKEWFSLVYVAVLLPFFYLHFQKIISHHPGADPWKNANRAIFGLTYFIFLNESVLQYLAYHYYILDSNARFYNIVLFRSLSLTLFWVFGFTLAGFLFYKFKGVFRYFLLGAWSVLFTFAIAVWVVNAGILYYSGLYFSPVVVQHMDGSGGVVNNLLTYVLIGGGVLIFAVFVAVLLRTIRIGARAGSRYFSVYSLFIGILAVGAFSAISSFQNTPESVIASSFYDYYFGKIQPVKLDPILQKKLKKFGLDYDPDKFSVISRLQIFSTSTQLLPDKLLKNKPNILIIELESVSSRLTDVYGKKFQDVTPNLKRFAEDPDSTVFRNYYNASTPTITGTLSQLCSFLPPTGHNEIQGERKLQSHHLQCLPDVLKEEAEYKYAAYVTAVDKEFAHKDGIFKSMGMDEIYGTAELKKHIKGAPLSWGYSDHQLFPAVWNFMKTAPQPFLMVYATVDTHPPFNLPKDAVNYEDGSRPVLNMFHSTDDAFGKFWDEFKASAFYDNTIVIAVADHAIFPGALITDLFPEEEKTLSFYDENFFVMYVPGSILPKEVEVYSSGIDVTPTILHMLGINIPNTFEGHSIFDDRALYPNLLGMHEIGLYINQITATGERKSSYDNPRFIKSPKNYIASSTPDLTLYDYKQFYDWKRQMFEEGRFWKAN